MAALAQCFLSLSCSYQLESDAVGHQGNATNGNDDYGIVVCAGEGEFFLEMITMVEQTRYTLQSQLPIAVAHCDELSAGSIAIVTSIPDVRVINICSEHHPYFRDLKPRLSGFFCKPAALLQSPFRHTIVVDTDVIFFKKPELLFNSTQYLSTGTLFFRDRWTKTALKLSLTKSTGDAKFALEYLKMGADLLHKLHKTRTIHRKHAKNNGSHHAPVLNNGPLHVEFSVFNLSLSNAFWRHAATGKEFTPDHWQVRG